MRINKEVEDLFEQRDITNDIKSIRYQCHIHGMEDVRIVEICFSRASNRKKMKDTARNEMD